MPPSEPLRVFISWSGDLSRGVALALRDWLPSLFDQVAPWMSDQDIASGTRSLDEIHTSLASTSFGIIVVTKENQGSSWLNYESGAISKSIAAASTHVVPLLVDIDSPSQLTGPLAQFQARKLDGSGMTALVETLADSLGVSRATATQRLRAFWPELNTQVDQQLAAHAPKAGGRARRRSSDDILDEVLALVRDIARNRDRDTASSEIPLDEATLIMAEVIAQLPEFAMRLRKVESPKAADIARELLALYERTQMLIGPRGWMVEESANRDLARRLMEERGFVRRSSRAPQDSPHKQ